MRFLSRLRIPIFAGDPVSSETAEAEIWYNSFLDQLRFKTPDTPPVSISMGARFNDFAPNRWYMTTSGAPTTATIVVNRVYAVPLNLARYAELSGISLEISAQFTTAGTVRTGIYYSSYQNTPTTLIADYGTVAATTGIKTWTPSGGITFLAAGSYFLVAVVQGGTGGTPTFRSSTGVHEQVGDPAATPTATFFNGTLNTYYATTTQAGVLPASFGTVGGSVAGPRMAIKFNN
jgi:hypothetical protein